MRPPRNPGHLFAMLDPASFLFVTLDSCRYDTFESANAPNIKSIGPLHRAQAPGNFTYASHAAMFVGFTPGVASERTPYVNPKFGKIFRMDAGGSGKYPPFAWVQGGSVMDGLKSLGYLTVGSGAANWFNPETPTGQNLTRDFDRFYHPGNTYSLGRQVAWLQEQIDTAGSKRVFAFLNVGETHVPYYHEDAPWPRLPNPCVPFSEDNDAHECRRRQTACLEFVDQRLEPLLRRFDGANVVVCADHGDAWGEDGVWEHGVHHPKVMEVPLLFRLGVSPSPEPTPAKRPTFAKRALQKLRWELSR